MALFTTDLGIQPLLTERFGYALQCAATWHRYQVRKGDTPVPYVSHLLAVCSLVLEAGGNEDEAIAALLHDCLEDVRDEVGRQYGYSPENTVEHMFGEKVLKIVLELSEDKSLTWQERKDAYANSILTMSESALKVGIADKLHNARCLLVNTELVTAKTISKYKMYVPNYQQRLLDIHNWTLSRQVMEMESIYERIVGNE